MPRKGILPRDTAEKEYCASAPLIYRLKRCSALLYNFVRAGKYGCAVFTEGKRYFIMSEQRKKRERIFLLFSAAMLAATVFASCRDVSGRMTEAQSAHEFTDRAGQTASTERVTPAMTEPERDAQFTSTAGKTSRRSPRRRPRRGRP